MKKWISVLVLALGWPIHVNAEQATAQQTQATKAAGIWIDVRSAEEFQQGHLSGALNITHTEIAKQISQIAPDKNQPINLYCRLGKRAEAARNELQKLGYTNVVNHGGYTDLVKQGLR